MQELLWERVGELADRGACVADLRHHKLHLIAASRMRERGEPVPAELRHDERYAAAIGISIGALAKRLLAAGDAPFMVMKGPEVAARWPSSRLRPWTDLDVLVEDPPGFQAALLRAGFVEIGEPEDYETSHHLRPVAHPLLPMAVEVHRRPKWPTDTPPTFDELAAAAVPNAFGVDGVLAPCPAHHAVLLAGHAWEHDPLSSIGALADVTAMMLEAGRDEAQAIARAWGVGRVWRATTRAADQLLLAPTPVTRAPIWRRHLNETRERTVFEGHVERLVGPVAAAPLTCAPTAAARAVLQTLRPWPGEGWTDKLHRSRLSLRHASLSESEHDNRLFPDGRREAA